MQKTFGADLKAARKRCGLSQRDCAYLLGVDQAQISRLEAGDQDPTLEEITLFYLIFGAWSLPLWNGLLQDMVTTLRERLVTLPEAEKGWQQRAARKATLYVLAQRLYGLTEEDEAH